MLASFHNKKYVYLLVVYKSCFPTRCPGGRHIVLLGQLLHTLAPSVNPHHQHEYIMNSKWGNQSRVFGLIRNQVIQKYWRCNHLYRTSFFKSHFGHLVSEQIIGLRSLFWTTRYPLLNYPVRIKAWAPGLWVNLRFPGSFKYYSCFISFNSHKFA